MNDQLTQILSRHQDGFHPHIPPYRQNRFVQIVVLRETKSHAIFTTEGPTLDVERLQAGLTTQMQIDRVVMYKRKQVAPERRTGKALQRDLGILTDLVVQASERRRGAATREVRETVNKRSECQVMGHSCGCCADCILYGFAATKGNASQRARVLTDSGFVVRSLSQIMRNITLNAIAETTAGGVAGSAFAARENVLPQVFLPTVETLVDVTAAEFVYVLGNILKTTRYGAESNREGFVRNHLIGIYFSDVELFSNLELTQLFYDALAEQTRSADGTLPDSLSLQQFHASWPGVERTALASVVGSWAKLEELEQLHTGIRGLYADRTQLRALLVSLDQEAQRYVREHKEKRKTAEPETSPGEESVEEE